MTNKLDKYARKTDISAPMSLGDVLAGVCTDIDHCNCFVLIR